MSDTTATPTNVTDVVAVYDSNFNQIFANARPMKASVKEKAKVMKHPVESGATIADFRIIEPIEIDLHLTLIAPDFINTYNEIKQVFIGDNLILVQTNTGVYDSMTIANMPHDEDPAKFDVVLMTLTLIEVDFAITSTSKLPAIMTTKKGGNKNGNPTTKTEEATKKVQNSALYDLIHGTK